MQLVLRNNTPPPAEGTPTHVAAAECTLLELFADTGHMCVGGVFRHTGPWGLRQQLQQDPDAPLCVATGRQTYEACNPLWVLGATGPSCMQPTSPYHPALHSAQGTTRTPHTQAHSLSPSCFIQPRMHASPL